MLHLHTNPTRHAPALIRPALIPLCTLAFRARPARSYAWGEDGARPPTPKLRLPLTTTLRTPNPSHTQPTAHPIHASPPPPPPRLRPYRARPPCRRAASCARGACSRLRPRPSPRARAAARGRGRGANPRASPPKTPPARKTRGGCLPLTFPLL